MTAAGVAGSGVARSGAAGSGGAGGDRTRRTPGTGGLGGSGGGAGRGRRCGNVGNGARSQRWSPDWLHAARCPRRLTAIPARSPFPAPCAADAGALRVPKQATCAYGDLQLSENVRSGLRRGRRFM